MPDQQDQFLRRRIREMEMIEKSEGLRCEHSPGKSREPRQVSEEKHRRRREVSETRMHTRRKHSNRQSSKQSNKQGSNKSIGR